MLRRHVKPVFSLIRESREALEEIQMSTSRVNIAALHTIDLVCV